MKEATFQEEYEDDKNKGNTKRGPCLPLRFRLDNRESAKSECTSGNANQWIECDRRPVFLGRAALGPLVLG
jgi:hypothetical protein